MPFNLSVTAYAVPPPLTRGGFGISVNFPSSPDAAASYDGGIFPCMETFLRKLKAKNFQKRTVGYIQNGTWAPCTAKQMQAIMGELKNITNAEPVVTIKSAMKEADVAQLEALADALMA